MAAVINNKTKLPIEAIVRIALYKSHFFKIFNQSAGGEDGSHVFINKFIGTLPKRVMINDINVRINAVKQIARAILILRTWKR